MRAASQIPIIDPAGQAYIWWLAIVMFAVWYNIWLVILRVAFNNTDSTQLLPLWLTLDYVFAVHDETLHSCSHGYYCSCDFIFVLDIIVRVCDGKMCLNSRMIQFII